tara:strand:- start:309 stop:1025 length:717 start_codon:yes stop_codon:yes gene_type:complete
MNDFHFKQFSIQHHKDVFKVGTDGVLIGAWALESLDPDKKLNILDVGTGTGLIALMLAQRFSNASVTAIDQNAQAAEIALANIQASPWRDRVEALYRRLQDVDAEGEFDVLVSNPPFFENDLKAAEVSKTQARHTDELPHKELIDHAFSVLKPDGVLAIVLPVQEGEAFKAKALQKGFYLQREAKVSGNPDQPAKRLLMEFSKVATSEVKKESFAVEKARHQYTERYTALTRAFYLKL